MRPKVFNFHLQRCSNYRDIKMAHDLDADDMTMSKAARPKTFIG